MLKSQDNQNTLKLQQEFNKTFNFLNNFHIRGNLGSKMRFIRKCVMDALDIQLDFSSQYNFNRFGKPLWLSWGYDAYVTIFYLTITKSIKTSPWLRL